MKCTWRDIPDSTNERGWRKVECVRCGLELNHTHHGHDKIRAYCKANPFIWEIGYWFAIVLGIVWLRESSWIWLKRRLGFRPKCGCQERQSALNTFGYRLFIFVQNLKRRFSALWYNQPNKE